MYKKSFYNIEVDKNSEYSLMYNTYSGIFTELDEEGLEIYNNIENIDEHAANIEIIDLMKKAGFIVQEDIDEVGQISILRNLSRNDTEAVSLTIAPTMYCNMACPYCFEKHTKEVMSEETQHDLVEFVEKYLKGNSCKHLEVTWFGGEPLLETQIIYNLSDALIKICSENDVDYGAGIITNGALLDRETAQKLRGKKLHLHKSL